MKCQVYIYGVNALYSQTYADIHNNGKESPDNFKYDWEDELEITSIIKRYTEDCDSIYFLEGFKSNESFKEPVENMRLISLFSDSGRTQIGCSESILDRIEIENSDDLIKIYLYIKDYEPYANPVPGIYIASKDFPNSLINK